MPKSLAAVLLTAFASTAPFWANAGTVLAQGAQPGAQPSLPPAPQPTPSFQVGPRAPGALPGVPETMPSVQPRTSMPPLSCRLYVDRGQYSARRHTL